MLYDAINGNLDLTTIILYAVSSLFVIFLTLPIHEFAHAFVATKLGDPTAKNMGRLTINPLAHIDWLGAASILFFGFGWANPVPVNMRYFKNPKLGMAITAFAGPFSNIILALIALFFCNLFCYILLVTEVVFFFYLAIIFENIALISVMLAVFNIIPVPPLDGSKILAAFLPDRTYYRLMQYERYFSIILLVLIFSNVLDTPINFLTDYVFYGLDLVAGYPFRLLLGLV